MKSIKEKKNKGVVKSYYGPIGGFCESVVMQPIETIKTLKQSGQWTQQYPSLIKRPWKLYRGYNAFLTGMLCKYYIRFSVITNAQDSLRKSNLGINKYLINSMAGFMGGFCESMFITPFELIKTRLQTRDAKAAKKTNMEMIKCVIDERGLSGMYRGYASTALRQSINQSFNISFYYFMRDQDWYTPTVTNTFLLGMVSGSIGPTLNNPFDVIKTRYMNKNYNYNSFAEATKDIVQKEGLTFLFTSGLGLRIFRVGVGQAIVFNIVELLRKYDV